MSLHFAWKQLKTLLMSPRKDLIRIADIHERQTEEQSGRRGLTWTIRPQGRYGPEVNEIHEARARNFSTKFYQE
eukprot:466853-Karenia_brevis.AAC.1